jgi:hypothetical protein
LASLEEVYIENSFPALTSNKFPSTWLWIIWSTFYLITNITDDGSLQPKYFRCVKAIVCKSCWYLIICANHTALCFLNDTVSANCTIWEVQLSWILVTACAHWKLLVQRILCYF